MNIAIDLSHVSKNDLIKRSVWHFRNADRNYGDRVLRAVMEQRANRKYAIGYLKEHGPLISEVRGWAN